MVKVKTEDELRIYVRTILFLFIAVTKRLYPDVQIEVRNTLGKALYCVYKNGDALSVRELQRVEEDMRKEIAAATPIERTAKENVYRLLGTEVLFLGELYADVGSVSNFKLVPYEEGIVIEYPLAEEAKELCNFADMAKLNEVYQETEAWATLMQCNTVAKLNAHIENGTAEKIIQISEALQEKKFAAVADMIAQHRDKVKLILIAGPSSSGKTSTTQRLTIQLAVNGMRAIPVSMDDYYLNRVDTPRKENGDYDFEAVEAIDLELFNEHMNRLMKGEVVKMPKYNFQTGLREYRGKELQMTENTVLIVEGIHGLNDKLTAGIPEENKVKIYVSALTPMSFDDYNRINTTDMRLMRRMVRDSQFRSHDALATLARWDDVRYGEEKYIFPFQCSADVIINTTLIYELAVIKKYAEPLLKAVPQDSGRPYMIAQRLLKILMHVKSLEDSIIPNNSLLREFIGGSVFKEAL